MYFTSVFSNMLQHKMPDKIIKVIYFSLIAFTCLNGTQLEVYYV